MSATPSEPAGRGNEDAARPEGRGGLGLAFDLGVAAVLYLTVTVGLLPWYSTRLFGREEFRSYFSQGVYQFRILGPDVVLWLDRSVISGDPLGSHLVVNGRHPHAADLFTAITVVNAVSLVAVVLLARAIVRRARIAEPARSLVMVVLLSVVAISLSTVTPYDLPSLALILAILVVADLRSPWYVLAIPLVVVGVLTRESALLAVAALLARSWVVPPTRRRVAVIVAAAVVGVAAYLGVRIGSSSPSFWEALTIEGNLARLIQWMGLAMMAVVYLIWRRVCRLAGLDGPLQRRAVWWFWVFASPYVVTSLLTGYWFELRLLVPLVVCELWLRGDLRQDASGGTSRACTSTMGTSGRT